MENFPLWALLPKRETTAAQFVAKYPSYDGRGIKIAILDTGVDPGADGLQTTTDGKPKIIDMMDASGAGDVDTSTVVEVDSDGNITGITGRKLKIPKSWKTPTGKYHIGVKNIYELYPKPLLDRMQKEYTDNEWTPVHKTAQTEALRNLQQFKATNDKSNSACDDAKHSDSIEKKLLKDELQSRHDILDKIGDQFTDLGPTCDCIVFHDGNTWNAAVDTTGNLDECIVLQNYSECLKYGTISVRDQLNYAINIHNDGNLLEIVGMCSSHGTHVASIAAAHFPDEPDKNGVAPGAQIVSICTCDSRLNINTDTGTSLMRAFSKVIETKCDLVSMSCAANCIWTESRILELAHDLVNKYGIIFVSCNGNDGPALSTICTPPALHSSSIIGVSAYVSPDMMTAMHSMLSQLPAMAYSWTSRGPTINGDLGVSVCAPGGAITSVPNWELTKSLLKNGTSMSAPNAAGCVALLLSSLKAQNIAYSPYSIRRSIENTALKIQNYEPLTHGNGLIQVEKAYEYLIQFKQNNLLERDIRFHISCSNNDTSNGTNQLGIYLRNSFYADKPSLHSISINPIFLDDKRVDAKRKIDFEMTFSLVCDQQWVNCPTFLHMSYAKREISVKLDPTVLETGYHFSMIRAYDIKCPEKGPIFQIPITVIKPIEMPDKCKLYKNLSLKPGYLNRQFIQLSRGTTGAVFKIKNLDTHNSGTFVMNALQLKPQSSFRTIELNEQLTLTPYGERNFSLKVTGDGDNILEVVIGKLWSCIGETNVKFRIKVFGLTASPSVITMLASDGVCRVDIHSTLLHCEEIIFIHPDVSLRYLIQPLTPNDTKAEVTPLSKRDIIPESRQCYQMVLTYSLKLTREEKNARIVCPLLTDLRYECEYESQLWMIFDSNKRLYGTGGPSKYSVDLPKGDYTIRLQLRHESVAMLEKLRDTPLQIRYDLPTSVRLEVHETYRDALLGNKLYGHFLRPLSESAIFISANWSSIKLQLPITDTTGWCLVGRLHLRHDETCTFIYVIDSSAKNLSSTDQIKNSVDSKVESSDKVKLTLDEQYNNSFNELKVSWLPKLDAKSAEQLYIDLCSQQKLISNKIDKSSLVLARIQSVDSIAKDSNNSIDERINSFRLQITLADDILNTINFDDLISSLAVYKQQTDKSEFSKPVGIKPAKDLEKQKSIILDALVKKGLAICYLIELNSTNPLSEENIDNSADKSNEPEKDSNQTTESAANHLPSLADADKVYDDICKLIDDPYDSVLVEDFVEKHALIRDQFARALKLYFGKQDTHLSEKTARKCIDLFAKLGWNHCHSAYNRSFHVLYPTAYRLF